jgi:proteasome lid subunit RPN8/RPN11
MLRNLRAHPLVSAHLEPAEGLVVVVEGRAVAIADAGPDHVARIVADYNAKYDWDIAEDEFVHGVEIHPDQVFAWRSSADRDFHDYDGTRFDLPG